MLAPWENGSLYIIPLRDAIAVAEILAQYLTNSKLIIELERAM
jgi:hypothetical protein